MKAVVRSPRLSADVVRGWRADLATMPLPTDDSSRVDLLRAAEELKSAAAALQARVTVELDASQRAEQEAAGVDPREVGRGVAAQIGLARRESPARGARDLGLARALVGELPRTLEALSHGTTTEWCATLIARETACLTREDRSRVDAELAARPGGLGSLGDRAVESAARAIAQRLDPYAATRRARRAETERRVSLRPAPDTMSILSGLLPVRQGVAALASLTRHADSLRATGDPRSRGQTMADTLVERVTGQAVADDVPVEVQLVISDQSLLHPDDTAAPAREAARSQEPSDTDERATGQHQTDEHQTDEHQTDEHRAVGQGAGTDTSAGSTADDTVRVACDDDPLWQQPAVAEAGEAPAWLTGYGPIPAPLARSWVRDHAADVWVRRLYADPNTGALVAMDSRRRTFTGQLRAFVIARDQVCRTPWCDAPIRHVDHITRATDGGPTSGDNAQGLCAACNLAREAPGWSTTGTGSTVFTQTPTGHTTTSSPTARGAPEPRRSAEVQTRGEFYFRDLVLIA